MPTHQEARELVLKINKTFKPALPVKASQLYTYALMAEIYYDVFYSYLDFNKNFSYEIENKIALTNQLETLYYDNYLCNNKLDKNILLQELGMSVFLKDNLAFDNICFLHKNDKFETNTDYKAFSKSFIKELKAEEFKLKNFANYNVSDYVDNIIRLEKSLYQFFIEPQIKYPKDYYKQLEFILNNWFMFFSNDLRKRILKAISFMQEEYFDDHNLRGVHSTSHHHSEPLSYRSHRNECEAFTDDFEWMPNVVMIAKNILVWLDQLSKKYKQKLVVLNDIPEIELIRLKKQGINSLWLIGLWERSYASKKIKQKMGKLDAEASAYSLDDNKIADCLGGWYSFNLLKNRCENLGIRLASDMVPNHTAMDSTWVAYRPELFMQLPYCPYPEYSFNGENLSNRDGIGIYLEDHYYNKTDASVVFKRVDFASGDTRYIYHGNDGTATPWNDTAQIDFLNPQARKAVIDEIINIARNFSIIRFDAAMVLVKDHIRRLWYPAPGFGGSINTRSDFAISDDDFSKAIPIEFWREVVDRIAKELPSTLLLAEAFWMLEGYFVRSLGMHRVYNSAFMDMLAREDNEKYRITIKNTQEFDLEILKRFVNFMSNPDEETAIDQFGDGDKYFGVATMMCTMPGLPMIAHGQLEGFTEKYGMEYAKSYYDETPNYYLTVRHSKQIYPLLRNRNWFSSSHNFRLYDFNIGHNSVNQSVFSYSNNSNNNKTLVFYNNSNSFTDGYIKNSTYFTEKNNDKKITKNSSLSYEFSLQGDSNKYFILQNFITKDEYLFSSKQISDNGFALQLGAYECKVFKFIEEVYDTDGFINNFYNNNYFKGFKNLKLLISKLKNNSLCSNALSIYNVKNNLISLFLEDWRGQSKNFKLSDIDLGTLATALKPFRKSNQFNLAQGILEKNSAIKNYWASCDDDETTIHLPSVALWQTAYLLNKCDLHSISSLYFGDKIFDEYMLDALARELFSYENIGYSEQDISLARFLSSSFTDDLLDKIKTPKDFFVKMFTSEDFLKACCGLNYFNNEIYFNSELCGKSLNFIYFIMQASFGVKNSDIKKLDASYKKYAEKSDYKVYSFLKNLSV